MSRLLQGITVFFRQWLHVHDFGHCLFDLLRRQFFGIGWRAGQIRSLFVWRDQLMQRHEYERSGHDGVQSVHRVLTIEDTHDSQHIAEAAHSAVSGTAEKK